MFCLRVIMDKVKEKPQGGYMTTASQPVTSGQTSATGIPESKEGKVESGVRAVATGINKVWVGYVNLVAPDGRYIPAREPQAISYDYGDEYHGSRGLQYDKRDRIVVSYDDGFGDASRMYRVADYVSINYAEYGLVKIGNIWVDAQNKRLKEGATELASSSKGACVIL